MKTPTAFILGALAGVLVGHVLFGLTAKRQYENQLILGILDQAYVALQISQDRHDPLRISIESELPAFAIRLSEELPPSPLRDEALWMIRMYYDRNGIQIPVRIEGIMRDLPSEPPAHIMQVAAELDKRAVEEKPDP